MKVTHETHVSLKLIEEENGSVRWRRRTKAKKWKGRVHGERREETRIGEKKKTRNREKRKTEKNKKREEKGGRKKRKRGKGKRKRKRKRKRCRAVSRPERRRTQNCATRGRFPPTPVHFTPKGRVGA